MSYAKDAVCKEIKVEYANFGIPLTGKTRVNSIEIRKLPNAI